MSETSKRKASASTTDAFKDAMADMSSAGKTATQLVETYALEVQKQWLGAAEAYVKFWGQLTRSALELAVGASVLQAEGAQKAVERLKRTADEV